MTKRKHIVSKKSVIYVKKDLVLIMTMKNIKSEIIVIMLENIEELLTMLVI